MRFSASWAIAAAAIFLATPKAANTQAPAGSAESLPPAYAVAEESVCEPGAPRLLGPVIHARPIAEAELEESSLLRCEASPSLPPLRRNASISDHLFGEQCSSEAMSWDGGGPTFDESLPAELAGIDFGETNLSLDDMDSGNDIFLHAGTACGVMAGEIHFQGDN